MPEAADAPQARLPANLNLPADAAALLEARENISSILERAPELDHVLPDLRRSAGVIEGISQVWREALAGRVLEQAQRALPALGRAGDLAGSVLRSVDGDVLDGVVWQHYGGHVPGTVEAVLAANDGLAALGPVLPPGTRIELPDLQAPPAVTTVLRLWEQ